MVWGQTSTKILWNLRASNNAVIRELLAIVQYMCSIINQNYMLIETCSNFEKVLKMQEIEV